MNNFLKHLIILVNFLGFLLGFSAYLPQLSTINPVLWLFVIDCPLAALLFIIFLFGFRNKYFEALVRTTAFKYGVWTIIITLSSPALLSYEYAWINLLLHSGLIIESFLFAKQKLLLKHFVPAGVFLLLNDLSDYLLLTHPIINNDLFTQTAIFTFLLTLISISLFVVINNKRIT